MSGPDKAAGRFGLITEATTNIEGDFLKQKENSSLFEIANVGGERWNQLYPYQLIVVEKDGNSWKESINRQLKFTLPITPQSIEIDMPFAITTSATLGGVVEEHNGAPFRIINFQGTTGVLPLKGAPDSVPGFNLAEGIFAGTVNAATTLKSDLIRSGIVNPDPPNVVPESEFDNIISDINVTSGYFQWHLLRRFFETYATLKKMDSGKTLRLAFAIWKDEAVYLVTPMMFKTQRDGANPYEYRYNLGLKAWARVKLQSSFKPDSTEVVGRDPNKFARIVTILGGARQAIENARKIIQSVRGDIKNALLTPLREVQLAAKGVAGVALALSDLPGNVISDSEEAIVSIRKELEDLKLVPAQIKSKIEALGSISAKSNVGDARLPDTTKQALTGAHPVNKIFSNPDENFNVFSKIDPSKVKLPLNVQRQIKAEKARVAAFTRKDFEIRRDSIVSVLVDFAEAVGAGSTTYNEVYGVQPRTTTTRVATEEDFEVIYNLNNVITEVNKLCVSNTVDPDQQSAIEYIAGLAKKSGIAFTEPRSKFLVPFLTNHTLEQLALQYLGDANRWHEIAALNGLREPYVDEVGFDVFLSINGTDNTVQVADVTNLYLGQTVYISSATAKPEKRRINGIQKITTGIYILTLSGEPDLEKFQTVSQAKIHAYLPDTVNSQMSIYIPSQGTPELEDFQVKPIQGIDYFDNLVRVGGISLLLDNNNDIVFTTDGRTKLAVGLNNIVQKARIALATPKGSLLQHPDYGLPVKVGDSTADVSAKNVLKSIQDMFSKDPSFSGVTSAAVNKTGGTTRITINVGIAGTSQIVPITAEIRR